MEVRYKKDMNHNYLILAYEGEADYELNMMLNNKLNGLLKGSTNTFNGNTELYYDISSKQPLSRIYLKREMSLSDVKGIIMSMELLLEELRRFLLSADYVVFDAEYCYCNPENRKPEWIFYPGEHKSDGMRNLAEFLIERVNHAEHKAVDMAYRFYKMVKDDRLTVKALRELLEEYQDLVEEKNVIEQKIFGEEDFGVISDHRDILQGVFKSNESNIPTERSTWLRIKDRICNDLNSRFGERWGKIGRKRVELAKEEYKQKEEWWKSNTGENRKESIREEQEWLRPNVLTEWESYGWEQEDKCAGETIVMGVRNATAARRLRSLSKGGDSYIYLQKLPCILGKMEECSDIVLKDSSVSRMHAKIFEEKGELYLQDLNSTNGSYINNLELEGDETVRLKVGDEIIFGNLRYVYE